VLRRLRGFLLLPAYILLSLCNQVPTMQGCQLFCAGVIIQHLQRWRLAVKENIPHLGTDSLFPVNIGYQLWQPQLVQQLESRPVPHPMEDAPQAAQA